MTKATFAAGCFWGVEEAFRQLDGVNATRVGYTGGHSKNPTYQEVCNDQTGHAEAVEVEYDPNKISYPDLLSIFFDIHNPTTANRQGLDIGSQYRSAIFYHDEEQKTQAYLTKKHLQDLNKYSRTIVTEIVPAREFYPAEEYHQQYLQKRGSHACNIPTSHKKSE